jgi:hypothetical protein
MKATILCDDSKFATQARALLRRVGDRAGISVRWAIKTWPVNALHHASLSERALLESADAHLIVIPGNHARSLSSHLSGWLNRWASLRELGDAAVGVIDDDTDSVALNGVSLELRLLVQRHGLNLIHDEGPLTKGATKLAVRFPPKEKHPLPIKFAHMPQTGSLDVFRGFGIND